MKISKENHFWNGNSNISFLMLISLNYTEELKKFNTRVPGLPESESAGIGPHPVLLIQTEVISSSSPQFIVWKLLQGGCSFFISIHELPLGTAEHRMVKRTLKRVQVIPPSIENWRKTLFSRVTGEERAWKSQADFRLNSIYRAELRSKSLDSNRRLPACQIWLNCLSILQTSVEL